MHFPVRFIALLLAVLAALTVPLVNAEDELLDPEVAFRFSAEVISAQTIRVRYQIAPGYYLYRDRFRFSVLPARVKIGAPHLPAGETTEDEFFGKTVIYRGELLIDLPLEAPIPAAGVSLSVVSQGCAEVGVCYIPLTQTAQLLPATSSSAIPKAARTSAGLLARLQGVVTPGEDEEEFLPVDKAFVVDVKALDARTLLVRLSPADGYYLYRDKIKFSLIPLDQAVIDKVVLPRGEPKQDPNFGLSEIFHSPVQARIQLRRSGPAPASDLTLTVGFQGCSDKGLCYSPVTQQHAITVAALASPASAETSIDNAALPLAAVSAAQPLAGYAEDARIAGLLKTGNFWLVMVSFVGFGLLLSLTPCVLPMIPILSALIAGQGKELTRKRGLALSATYVLGMAVAYATAGVLAGLSGSLLSAALQNAWVLGSFAGIFVLLSLSMFGFYELQLPASWQTRASAASNRLRGGRFAGVFLMGALSAVIVGPCVAAPLAGALLYVSQSRDVLLGGAALFAMALGMGVPLMIIGASAGALLPRTGAWMQGVKNFFGVLLLGAAVWMISPLIPVLAQMLLWSALLIISGIYLHAIDPLPVAASGFRKLWKGIGVIALLLGIALLVGGLSGGRDLFQPLSGFGMRTQASDLHTPFIRVTSVADLDQALAATTKPVMLDFYADWCVSCKEMERFTFRQEEVKNRMGSMLLLQADVTANTAQDGALLQRFGLFGPPGIVFFDRAGREIKDLRVIGYRSAEGFLPVLERAAAAY